jgi:hypothetical protein
VEGFGLVVRAFTGLPQMFGEGMGMIHVTLTEPIELAIAYLQGLPERFTQFGREIIDGLGDVFVTIILAAEMAGLRIEDCLAAAYQEIKGRTGSMQGGVFVKDKPC